MAAKAHGGPLYLAVAVFIGVPFASSSWTPVGLSEPLRGGPGLRNRKSSFANATLADVDRRRLQTSSCNIQPLLLMAPPSFQDWSECIENGIPDLNRTIAGAEAGLLGNCWCESNVLQAVQNHSCCEHPDFVGLCGVDCQANCSSAAAQTCIRECPAMCLEADYAPESCYDRCHELDCLPYLLCITDHAQNTAHSDSGQLVCHDANFHSSPEMLAYFDCLQDAPMRTNWQRWNSQHHCFCTSSLKDAAERNNCCQAQWADPICNIDCRTTAECASFSGSACMGGCADTCDMIHPHLIRQSCHDECFIGDCDRYKTCEPPEQASFEYLCDNLAPPAANGCCEGVLPSGAIGETCPALCQSGRKYILPHGDVCQCFDCPTTATEAEQTINETFVGEASAPGGVSANVWQNGQTVLMDISRQEGLIYGATPQMQAMVVARNVQIRAAISRAEQDSASSDVEREIVRISAEWHAQIQLCARGGPEDPACNYGNALEYLPDYASSEPASQDDEDDADVMMFVVIIVAAVACCFGGVVVALYLRSQKSGQQGGGATTRPMDGDANVVVGRPVDDSTPPQFADGFAAAEGAPVAQGEKGDGEK